MSLDARRPLIEFLNWQMRLVYRCLYLLLRVWWFLRRPSSHGALAALWHEDRVLMLRTSYRPCYSLPGGFVGRGESSQVAACRELREELGIDLAAGRLELAWSGTLTFESRHDRVDIWEASVTERPEFEVLGREIVWAGWFTSAEALRQRLLPHVVEYLSAREVSVKW